MIADDSYPTLIQPKVTTRCQPNHIGNMALLTDSEWVAVVLSYSECFHSMYL
jgi:hypothetical protein